MKRELTQEEIVELFVFVKRKYVRYRDVQIELVDHLASDIEQYWIDHPDATFKSALVQVYAKFGIFGFSKIVTKKEAQMGKIWWREFKALTCKHMRLAHVTIFVLTTAIFTQCLLFINSPFWALSLITCIVFSVSYFLLFKNRVLLRKRMQYLSLQNWMLDSGAMTMGIIMGPFNMLVSHNAQFHVKGSIAISLIFSFLLFHSLYSHWYYLPFIERRMQEIDQLHPIQQKPNAM